MVRILPFGDRALLVELDALAEVLALHARLAASRPAGVDDLVPAARTILVRAAPGRLAAAHAWVEEVATGGPADASPAPAREIVLDVAYDGPDLHETADLLGIGAGELVRRHAETVWTAAFTGFAPGFAYLTGQDWLFDVPRLDTPRTRVPAGAVGLAGTFCGAYPRATPGGWRLIGTTGAALFDPDAADPALLAPGTRVRFRPVDAVAPARPAAAAVLSEAGAAFEVIEPGLRATIQDLGRPGRAREGIAVSGALDRGALRAANRLAGNREDAAGIEVTMGGFRARALRDLWIAVAGGLGPVRIGDRDAGPGTAVQWPEGAELQLGWLAHGARAYLAVRGGIRAADVAGSCATDTLAGLGPEPLSAGDALATADADIAPIPPAEHGMAAAPADDLVVELAPGPRADWFAASAHAALFDDVWTVTDHADRVGVRLAGPALSRVRDGELPSEGMVPGAVQVPPDGQPTILLADGPVTGGYPVIAVVTDASLDLLAQARPGSRIRFRHARPVP